MIRQFLILDKTSGNNIEIAINDDNEFLEVWPIEHNGEKNIVIHKRIHPYEKPPFIIREAIK